MVADRTDFLRNGNLDYPRATTALRPGGRPSELPTGKDRARCHADPALSGFTTQRPGPRSRRGRGNTPGSPRVGAPARRPSASPRPQTASRPVSGPGVPGCEPPELDQALVEPVLHPSRPR